MTRLIIALFAGMVALAPAAAVAAGPPDAAGASSMQALRSQVRANERGTIERTLALSDGEAKVFWPLYEDFQRDLEGITRRQNRAILDYIQAGGSMSSTNATRIALQILDAESDEHKVRERHFRKVLRTLPAKKAVRYIQLESRIRTLMHYDIADRMPLVE